MWIEVTHPSTTQARHFREAREPLPSWHSFPPIISGSKTTIAEAEGDADYIDHWVRNSPRVSSWRQIGNRPGTDTVPCGRLILAGRPAYAHKRACLGCQVKTHPEKAKHGPVTVAVPGKERIAEAVSIVYQAIPIKRKALEARRDALDEELNLVMEQLAELDTLGPALAMFAQEAADVEGG